MKRKYMDDLDDKPDWNMTLAFLMRLDKRLDERDMAAAEGDLTKWYRTLRVIYRMIYWKIAEPGHEKREEELEKKFNEIKNWFLGVSSVNRQVVQQVRQISTREAEILLDETDKILSQLLYDYEFIYPKKKEVSLEEEMEAAN